MGRAGPGGERAHGAPLRALVVAGTHSGVGKTTVTVGLAGALRRRGAVVQPFKVGPDFIDPLHHERASGRPSRTLDSWMLARDDIRELFARATADADVALVEGVMGLFDGSDGASERGSTAEVAKLLGLPVVLVVDASALARSAAALVQGYVGFDPALRVVGIILNNVGGEGHAALIREAIGPEPPVLGALPRQPEVTIGERHLGLQLPGETSAETTARLTRLVERHVDLERLLALATVARPAPSSPVAPVERPRVRIGVARDEAFCFTYVDNLELLAQAGAELVAFSPLREPLPAGLDGLYLGGGYPELHAGPLAANTGTRAAIRRFAAAGGPIYAECGGLMYLARHMELEGERYACCGVLPFATTMSSELALAYVEVETTGGLFGTGQRARGHLFHRSAIVGTPALERCYRLRTPRGEEAEEGYRVGNVLASYVHLHFASNPALAAGFVRSCRAFSRRRPR